MEQWSLKRRLVAVVVLAIAVGLSVWAWLAFRGDREPANTGLEQSLSASTEQTQKGQYDQALQTLKDAQQQATTTEEKVAILNNLGAAAANAGQLQEALDYYDQKHRLDPSTAANDGYLVGELYERLGKVQEAVAQFGAYIEYLQNNPDEDTQAQINSLTARLQQLKGDR